ncbi:hypothetical protein SCALM49S_01663 [Streptomyces californicus]
MPYGRWVGGRLARLFRPVAAVLTVWTLAAAVMLAAGVGEPTVRALVKLVWSPLWFLLVFAALTALTPLVARPRPRGERRGGDRPPAHRAGRPDRQLPAGPPPPGRPLPGVRHGLLGMSERAAMLGGELATGRTPDGGWEVTALLPTSTQTPRTTEEAR